jgi:hypothetical protein
VRSDHGTVRPGEPLEGCRRSLSAGAPWWQSRDRRGHAEGDGLDGVVPPLAARGRLEGRICTCRSRSSTRTSRRNCEATTGHGGCSCGTWVDGSRHSPDTLQLSWLFRFQTSVPERSLFGTPSQSNRIPLKSPRKPSHYPSRYQGPWAPSDRRVRGRASLSVFLVRLLREGLAERAAGRETLQPAAPAAPCPTGSLSHNALHDLEPVPATLVGQIILMGTCGAHRR